MNAIALEDDLLIENVHYFNFPYIEEKGGNSEFKIDQINSNVIPLPPSIKPKPQNKILTEPPSLRIHKYDLEPGEGWSKAGNNRIRDRHLSFGARGVLSYALSHSEGYVLSAESLADSSDLDGEGKVLKYLKELEHAGYSELVKWRDTGGRIRSGWVFHSKPLVYTEKPEHKVTRKSKSKNSGHSRELFPVVLLGTSNHLPELSLPVPVEPDLKLPGPVNHVSLEENKKERQFKKEQKKEEKFLEEKLEKSARSLAQITNEAKNEFEKLQFSSDFVWEYFQALYKKEHGASIGCDLHEKNACATLYSRSEGKLDQIEKKVQALRERKTTGNSFWDSKPFSPSVINKYWVELITSKKTGTIKLDFGPEPIMSGPGNYTRAEKTRHTPGLKKPVPVKPDQIFKLDKEKNPDSAKAAFETEEIRNQFLSTIRGVYSRSTIETFETELEWDNLQFHHRNIFQRWHITSNYART